MYMLGKEVSLWILFPLSTLALLIEVARVRSQNAAKLIYSLFGSIMRDKEKPAIGSPVVINGASWVMISATLLTLIFPVYIACLALAMFMLADAAAALVGRKFGRINWPHSPKTIEGSAAFFATALSTLWLSGIMNLYFIGLVALVATLLEVVPIPVNDNLRVPLIAGFLIFAIEKAITNPDLTLFF